MIVPPCWRSPHFLALPSAAADYVFDPRVYHQRAKWILEVMHASTKIDDVAVITQPHPWRIVFQFKDGKFFDVKIENYH